MAGGRRASLLILFAVALACFAVDLASKYAIDATIQPQVGQIELIPGWLRLINVRNLGGMFGLGFRFGSTANFLLATVSAIFIVLIVGWGLSAMPDGAKGLAALFGMILGGAAGNLYDRLVFGAVRDFIEVHFQDAWHYPTFNIADSCLVCAVAILVFFYSFNKPDVAPETPTLGVEPVKPFSDV